MAVSTYITNPDNQYNRVLLDPYEIVLIVMGVVGIYFDQTWMLVLCVLVYVFAGNVFRVKEFQRKGEGRALLEDLTFETDKIVIGAHQFNLRVIDNLKLEIRDYEGETIRLPGGTRRGFAKGINNVLEFEINGNKYSFTFYIESKLMKAALGELFIEWYREGIVFEETENGSKTYGLKHLTYKQIQELKHSRR